MNPYASATAPAPTGDHAFDAALVKLARSGVLYGPSLTDAVQAVTEMAAHALGVERVSVWIFAAEECLECFDLYEAGPDRHSQGARLCATEAPSYLAALETARALSASDAQRDPRTRELADYLRQNGITSMLDAPVVVDGRLAHVVCHEHIGPPREWSRAEEDFAATVSDMVALALQVHSRSRAMEALKESNEALRRSEERLRALVAGAPVSLFAVDRAGQLSMVEGSALLGPGHAAPELLGRTLREVLGGDCRAGTTTVQVDGRVLEVHAACVSATGGEVAETVGVVIDVTERCLVERRLRVLHELGCAISEARLDTAATVEAAARVLSEELDTPCVIRLAAGAAEPPRIGAEGLDVPLRRHGETLGVLEVGPNPDPAMTAQPDWMAEVADRLALALANARLFEEVREARARAEAAEQRLRVLNQGLERAVEERTRELSDALRELDAFSGSVAHDLRAPLRAMRGFSGMVLERCAAVLGPEDRALLKRVGDAGERMDRLIEDLLRLSTWDRAEKAWEPVSLSELAEVIVDDLRAAAPERDVVVTIEPGLVVTGDPGLLRVALENLIGNAWKFTSKRRRAHIRIGALPADAEPRVYFVEDDGAGFHPGDASSLFGPLVRVHSAAEFEGTGIGLAIAQRIVKRHGGRIWAEGRANQGATFYFTLEAPAAHGA